jgi:hypothetical protein
MTEFSGHLLGFKNLKTILKGISMFKKSLSSLALKKVPANTVVKLTIVRDMKAPTTYAKYRTKTRVIYAKLG